MNKIVKTTIACLIVLLCLDAIAIAQNAQGMPPADNPCVNEKARATPDEPCISISYDKFKAQTSIILMPITLYEHGVFSSLSFAVVLSSAGQTIERPEKAYFAFKYYSIPTENADALARRRDIDLLIDNVPYALGKVTLVSDEDDSGFIERRYAVAVPFKIIETIGSGKSVEMRAGSFEWTFSDAVKKSFRKLVELMPEKPKENNENKLQPSAKPSPKKPSTKTRRRS
jgi:hypothetical protein